MRLTCVASSKTTTLVEVNQLELLAVLCAGLTFRDKL